MESLLHPFRLVTEKLENLTLGVFFVTYGSVCVCIYFVCSKYFVMNTNNVRYVNN